MINTSFVIKKTIQFEHSIEYIIPSLSPEELVHDVKSSREIVKSCCFISDRIFWPYF